jgi:signal transduction histidine kinase/ActR/RegA family two-component response regulator
VDVAFLAPFDAAARTATIVAAAGTRTDAMLGVTFTPGQGGGGRVLEGGQPFTTEDERRDPGLPADVAGRAGPEELVSGAVVPLRFAGVVTGLLGVHTRERRQFGPRPLALLTTLADHAAIALENSRLYGELRAALAAAETSQQRIVQTERLRALGQMAGGVAHDFNNALAVILGRTQLLLRHVADPDVRRQLGVVETVAKDAARTVRGIQEFARMRRARPFHEVDLSRVVREVVEVTRTRWRDEPQAAGITYEVALDLAPVPPVAGDAAELREALTSIVFNALDAMPAGGRLGFRTALADGRVLCAIADTGAGMPEEVRRRVFDPFFTTKGERGSGLGLSMAYGIVSRHGGEIEVESAPGRGATFTVRLPVAAPAGAERPAAPPAAVPVVPGRTILVVDDEAEVRSVLAQLLEAQGHVVATAADGQAGLARLAAGGIDLMVTDLGMPGLSGWEVARLARLHQPTLPVVLVTGWGDQIDPADARVRGADAVVSKPFTGADLAAAIGQAVAAAVRP